MFFVFPQIQLCRIECLKGGGGLQVLAIAPWASLSTSEVFDFLSHTQTCFMYDPSLPYTDYYGRAIIIGIDTNIMFIPLLLWVAPCCLCLYVYVKVREFEPVIHSGGVVGLTSPFTECHTILNTM